LSFPMLDTRGLTHDFGGNIQTLTRPDGLPVARTSSGRCTLRPPKTCPPLPIPATEALVTASTPRSSNPLRAPNWASTHAPATHFCGRCAAWVSVASPYSSSGGALSSMSPSTPARSARSCGPPLSSHISSTTALPAEKTSLGQDLPGWHSVTIQAGSAAGGSQGPVVGSLSEGVRQGP